MTALLCAVGFSLVSQAEKISGTNFEALEVDAKVVGKTDAGQEGQGYWGGEGVDALIATNTFTAVEVQPGEGEPQIEYVPNIAPYTGAVGYPTVHDEAQTSEKFLSINTKGGELVRNIQEGGTEQSIGDGIYFDSMVQFTATDALDANAGSESDKLILWLRDNGDGTTNLVVNAGYLDDAGDARSTNYVVTSEVQADKWYRLTIQAIDGVISDGDDDYVGYAIYIDGVKAEYSTDVVAFDDSNWPYEVDAKYSYLYNENVHALFPSLLGKSNLAKKFTSVAFSGVGAVDDIEFTTEPPEFIGPEKEWVAQIGTQGYETLAEAVAAVESAGDAYTTVTILRDVTLDARLEVAAKKVDFEAASPVVVSGQLRVVNGASVKIGQNVKFTSAAHPTVFILGDVSVKPYTAGTAPSTLVVDGVVENTNPGFDQTFAISGNGLDSNGSSITVNGMVTNANGIAIYNPQPGSLTINGTVVGASAISIKDGALTVNNGAVVSATLASGAAYVGNSNGESPTGDAIIAPFYPASKGYGTPTVSILGGTITVADTTNCRGIEAYDFDGVKAPEDAASNVNVSGGTFNTPVETGYCATGFIPADNGDGTYGVELGWKIAFVNDDDTLIYATNVQANATVEYLGETPTKAADAEYTYTFKGWTPALAAATADATYKATYDATPVATPTPTVDGNEVDADKVFDNATSASVIVYPTEPTTAKNQDGTTTITFNNKSSTVPAYYDVTITQTQEATTYTVALKLNNTALPEIDEAVIDEQTKPAMEVTDGTTTVTLKETNAKLYYGLATADAPNAASFTEQPTTLRQGNGGAMQITIPVDSTETSKFYKVYVTDIAPAQSGN